MLNQLRDSIHADNVTAGWWSNINTGESILATRNRPEMLMLIVSELSEADEAFQDAANDDKLTYLPGFDVEIADAAIRLLDLAGADDIDLNLPTGIGDQFSTYDCRDNLMIIINRISAAMEGYRKGNTEVYHQAIRDTMHRLIALSHSWNFLLFNIIDQKRKYNAERADHKIENRLKAGGKAF